MVKDLLINPRKISPAETNCYFGYYDIPSFSVDGGRHLFHQVPFWDRMPAVGDVAALGVYDFESGDCRQFGESRTWNFQQGSMLQWIPALGDDAVIYNDLDSSGNYVGVISDVVSGARRYLDRPVASVDKRGRYGLSVNFSRLHDFRPGYGYCHNPDPFFDDPHPVEDGVFVVDLESGKSDLACSLDSIWKQMGGAVDSSDGEKILINHITFNPSGSRFVLLARVMKLMPPWLTTAITANRDGSDRRILFLNTGASHYWWSSDEELIFWGKKNGHDDFHLYRIHEPTARFEIIDDSFFRADGHCSTSPDGEWLLYDSYPDANSPERWQSLYLYNLVRKEGALLGKFSSMELPGCVQDLRCDLHPRWAPDSRTISFDSMQDGCRALYAADLGKVMEELTRSSLVGRNLLR